MLNALLVVVDYGQRVMLKTLSLLVHSQEDRPHTTQPSFSQTDIMWSTHFSLDCTKQHQDRLADWTELYVLILLFFFRLCCMTKKWNFCTNVTSHGKAAKQNRCGGKILYGWCPNSLVHLPAKNYNFKFAKIIVKKSTGLFVVDTVYNVSMAPAQGHTARETSDMQLTPSFSTQSGSRFQQI